MAKGITIKFKSDTRSQASVTHLFDALLGRPPSPTCAKCGGITVDEGPSNGRCKCAKTDSPNAHPHGRAPARTAQPLIGHSSAVLIRRQNDERKSLGVRGVLGSV